MTHAAKQVKQLDRVIIRFAGDSGDGMQLTGDRFTQESAAFGNDLSTLPNFPAEIRAPQGTLPGVSSFQVHFADHDILTAGDAPDVLVAMNPAALKANLGDLPKGATIIVDTDDFTPRNLDQGRLRGEPARRRRPSAEYALHPVDLTGMTVEAVKEFGLSRKDAARAKNMFALGPAVLDVRPPDRVDRSPSSPSGSRRSPTSATPTSPRSRPAGTSARPPRPSSSSYEIKPAPMPPGTYRNITGNLALSYGLVAGGVQSGLPVFLGSYPITPASDILHELTKHKTLRRHHLPGRGRDRRRRRRARRLLRRSARRHHHLRSGRRAEVRGDRPRRDDRAAAGRRRRPARRPVDRPADQDRAGRPAAGDVRPQRRGAGARSSRRSRPATASTPPSRPPGSRSPTAPR